MRNVGGREVLLKTCIVRNCASNICVLMSNIADQWSRDVLNYMSVGSFLLLPLLLPLLFRLHFALHFAFAYFFPLGCIRISSKLAIAVLAGIVQLSRYVEIR